MKNIFLIFKGILIGIAKIIPGISGSVLAISLGVYERLIGIIAKPFKINKDDIKFLFLICLGLLFGIGGMCKFVMWWLDNYYFVTMFLFSGLIIGGISDVTSKIDRSYFNILVFLITFCLFFVLINLKGGSPNYFMIGCIESFTTIIPGISGTAIFMALGWYDDLLSIFESIMNFNISFNIFCLFFGGFFISTILVSKMIDYLFNKFKSLAYSGVLGFMISSLFIMFKNVFSSNFSINDIFIGGVAFVFGYFVVKKINNIFKA